MEPEPFSALAVWAFLAFVLAALYLGGSLLKCIIP